jgi:hypothetical protein
VNTQGRTSKEKMWVYRPKKFFFTMIVSVKENIKIYGLSRDEIKRRKQLFTGRVSIGRSPRTT